MNKMSDIKAGRTLKIIKIGNSTGIILPKELLEDLGLQQGDNLHASVDGDTVALTRDDPEFERQMAVARDVMQRRKRALRELAK